MRLVGLFQVSVLLALQCGPSEPPVFRKKSELEPSSKDAALGTPSPGEDKAAITKKSEPMKFTEDLAGFPNVSASEFQEVELVTRSSASEGFLFTSKGKSFQVEEGKTTLKATIDLKPKTLNGKIYALPSNHFWIINGSGLMHSTKPMTVGDEITTGAPTLLAVSSFKGTESGKWEVLGVREDFFASFAGGTFHASFFANNVISMVQFQWPDSLKGDVPIAAGVAGVGKKVWIVSKTSQLFTAFEENNSWTIKKEPFKPSGLDLGLVLSLGMHVTETLPLKTSGSFFALEGKKFKWASGGAGSGGTTSPSGPAVAFDFAKAKGFCVGCHGPGGSVWTSADTESGWKEKKDKLILRLEAQKNMPPAGMPDGDRSKLIEFVKKL